MNVLLTGGAGYIGSHLVRALQAAGHQCVVIDDLSNGHRQAVGGARLLVFGLGDGVQLRAVLRDNKIDLVIHLAAFIEAGESVKAPGKYFNNNTMIGLTLLEAMRDTGLKKIVFSSTAAVYGTPLRVPIQEDDRLEPINPYGSSKLCVEYMLQAFAQAHGLGAVALRYFNVAGAHSDGDIGEAHRSETHIIPLVLQAATGHRPAVKVFGNDYDTPDGTCIRDYIHVCDLADAHILAAAAIEPGKVKVYNLGNGEGFSVREVIDTCCQVTGINIPWVQADRRAGDPSRLIASSQKAITELSWQPKYPYLKEIVGHAWAWHKNHPHGYGRD